MLQTSFSSLNEDKNVLSASENDQYDSSSPEKATGRWTNEEHQRFLEGLKKFGKNWKKIEELVGSRSGAQVRSHAQKYFAKLKRGTSSFSPNPTDLEASVKKSNRTRKASECSNSTGLTTHMKLNTQEPLVNLDENSKLSEQDKSPPSCIESTQSLPFSLFNLLMFFVDIKGSLTASGLLNRSSLDGLARSDCGNEKILTSPMDPLYELKQSRPRRMSLDAIPLTTSSSALLDNILL